MKILQVINSLGTGGAEKLLLETIPLYNRAGISMDILLLWDNDLPFVEELKKLNCCRIITLKHSANPKHTYSLSHIVKLGRHIRNYDLVHVHLFPALYYVALAKYFGRVKIKLVFTEHNTSNKRMSNKWLKPVEKWMYRQYDALIYITKEIRDIYSDYRGNKTVTKVIHNGVDISKIKNADPLAKEKVCPGLPSSDRVIIQVAAFRVQKDQATLIKAMEHLPANFKLWLVGEGATENSCKQLVKELGLAGRVLFLGQRMDVSSLIKTADYVVLSSKYEGLSLSSIEGMASGKPFLASDVPGLHEIVDNAGILFPFGNASALAAKIMELDRNPDYYDRVVNACMKRAEQYDILDMVQKHLHLYQQLILA